MKLLLAEDTRDLNRVIAVGLNHSGYEVDQAYDGEEALDFINKNGYDTIILDIMMPKKNGLEVLREIRRSNIVTPVLMLTAKAEIDDRVEGLDAGADDYLPKPFAMKELFARVRAMTRRKNEYSDKNLSFADFSLNNEKFELKSENSVRLSVKEFELLQVLILNQMHETDTQYILQHVWNGNPDAGADTVWLYIMYLKGKLKAVSSCATICGEKNGSFRLVEE